MSYDDWLNSPFRPHDCYGCKFNNPVTAHCSFKGRYCYYFIEFQRRNNPPQLKFDF